MSDVDGMSEEERLAAEWAALAEDDDEGHILSRGDVEDDVDRVGDRAAGYEAGETSKNRA